MREIVINDKSFRSLRTACSYFNISYWRAVRLCRKYQSANDDPSLAIKWLLGIQCLDYAKERKHFKYYRDTELSKLRVLDKKSRDSIKFKKEVLKNVL